MLLNVAFVDLGGTGQTGAQASTGEQRQAVFLGQVGPDTSVQDRTLDEARDVLVVETRL